MVIVDRLIKMVINKLEKVIIDILGLAEVIIHVVVQHHSFSNSIMTHRGSLFNLKFGLLLYYFVGIKYKLSTAFYLQTDDQTKQQNCKIEAFL